MSSGSSSSDNEQTAPYVPSVGGAERHGVVVFRTEPAASRRSTQASVGMTGGHNSSISDESDRSVTRPYVGQAPAPMSSSRPSQQQQPVPQLPQQDVLSGPILAGPQQQQQQFAGYHSQLQQQQQQQQRVVYSQPPAQHHPYHAQQLQHQSASNGGARHVGFAPAPSPHLVAPQGVGMAPAAASATNDVWVNGQVYSILEVIGKGGSSKVFKVLGADRKVYAVKRVRLDQADEETVESYINEIALLKTLQGNENIIKLYAWEVNRASNVIHLVMEYGDIDLAHQLKKHQKRIDENHLRLYWQQMLEAVHTIHEHRIIHGDLKPANFLFVEGGLKLIDFGIAKAIQNDKTSVYRDTQIGTLNYMSPEAIQDISMGPSGHGRVSAPRPGQKQVMKMGRASDIWSLGCILYAMVYGMTPFQRIANPLQKLQCIVDETHAIDFPPIANKYLLDVLQRCLQRDPSKRLTIPQMLEHPFLRPETLLNKGAAAGAGDVGAGAGHGMATTPSKASAAAGAAPPLLNEEQLQSLVQQLSTAQVSSPGSLNAISRAVLAQLQQGAQKIDVQSVMAERERGAVAAAPRARSAPSVPAAPAAPPVMLAPKAPAQPATRAAAPPLREINASMLLNKQRALQPVGESKATKFMRSRGDDDAENRQPTDLEGMLRKGLQVRTSRGKARVAVDGAAGSSFFFCVAHYADVLPFLFTA